MAEFNQARAIEDYTELQRRISVGAYTERSAEDHLNGEWPEDGIEESVHNLTELAAKQGLEFWWHKESGTWSLEPMSEETRLARQAAQEYQGEKAEIEKIADNRYRLRAHDQIMTLSADDVLEIANYALHHRQQLIQEASQEQEYQDTQKYMEHVYEGGEG